RPPGVLRQARRIRGDPFLGTRSPRRARHAGVSHRRSDAAPAVRLRVPEHADLRAGHASVTTEAIHPALDLTPTRKWLITVSVMLITVMQILDTSITNVALPHMQGSLSTSVEETSWVITSYLAANAIVIPATGWIMATLGR